MTGGASPRILIQDYHLCLAPRLLRDRLGEGVPAAGIGHFCHTPGRRPTTTGCSRTTWAGR
jgi:hypothetical protein